MTDQAAVPHAVRPPNRITATWTGEQRFDTGTASGPVAQLDGKGLTGQTPPDALLSALAACSGIDVVDYLAKRRTPVESLTIDVEGGRRGETPRRFDRLVVTYHMNGPGIDRVHAERAVQLAFEKYCTVGASLAPDITSHTIVVLNGEVGATVPRTMFGAA